MTAFVMIAGGGCNAYARPLFSCEPLHVATKEELLHQITPDLSGPRWEETTVNCRAFVIAANQILSALRPSAARLLKHPWFIEEDKPRATFQRKLRRSQTGVDVDPDELMERCDRAS